LPPAGASAGRPPVPGRRVSAALSSGDAPRGAPPPGRRLAAGLEALPLGNRGLLRLRRRGRLRPLDGSRRAESDPLLGASPGALPAPRRDGGRILPEEGPAGRAPGRPSPREAPAVRPPHSDGDAALCRRPRLADPVAPSPGREGAPPGRKGLASGGRLGGVPAGPPGVRRFRRHRKPRAPAGRGTVER